MKWQHPYHPAQDNAGNYDKGVLAEILEPIMGKGLIPADLETWKPRRRAIVPAFHRAWLGAMVAMFNACTRESARKLDSAVAAAGDAVRSRANGRAQSLGVVSGASVM